MTNMNHPLIRYHGGKFGIADWIISKFPAHKTYVEPFGGGGRQKNYEINLWDQYPQRIAKCAERFKQCVIENQEASKVISLYDADDTLFFVDPPYVRSTRTANVVAYRHEMTDANHEQLLDQLINVKGSVIITGYDHDLYNQKLSTWTKFTKSVQASGRLGGVTRQECLWISPNAQQADLFGVGL